MESEEYTTKASLMSKIATAASVVTAFIAGVSAILAIVTLDRTQRAWLAPAGISFAATPTLSKPLTLSLKFENVGKEPATAVAFSQLFVGLIPLRTGHGDVPYIEGFVWPRNDACRTIEPRPSDATFFPNPSGRTYEHIAHAFVGGDAIPLSIDGEMHNVTVSSVPSEIFDKKVSFLIEGCVSYQTETIWSGVIPGAPSRRVTAFCMYIHPLRDKAFIEGVWNLCPVGNYAN